jgi:hypothetical protein
MGACIISERSSDQHLDEMVFLLHCLLSLTRLSVILSLSPLSLSLYISLCLSLSLPPPRSVPIRSRLCAVGRDGRHSVKFASR